MAYEKTTWATGDVITAEKLNHAEDGIAAGSETGKIEYDPSTGGLHVSFNKITEMVEKGHIPWMIWVVQYESVESNYVAMLSSFYIESGAYMCEFTYMNAAHEVPTLTFFNTDPNAPLQGT